MLFQYGNKQASSQQSYGPQIDGLLGRGYEGLGKSGLTDRIGGYQSSIAPLNASQTWGTALAQDAGHLSKRDFSDGILGAGRGVNGDDIKGLMSPYLDTVGRTVLRDIGRSYDTSNAMAGASAANGVAFPGSSSGLALTRGQIARGRADTTEGAIAGLMSGAWDRASSLATANADRNLNANIAADGAYGNMMDRRGAAINGLLTTGGIAQGYDQAVLDLPYTDWQRFMSGLPSPGATTTENNPQYFDPLAFIGGLGTRMLGM